MSRKRWWKGVSAALAVSVSMLAAPPAMAQPQKEAPQPPYDVQGLPHTKIWVPWVFAFLFAAGVVALAFKNPHRTHLD